MFNLLRETDHLQMNFDVMQRQAKNAAAGVDQVCCTWRVWLVHLAAPRS
jgi:hypothetical protein